MELYLIRHAVTDPRTRLDPYSAALSRRGRAQARRLAAQCAAWGVQFLCASTMLRAQQTADAITTALPDILRWDLDELEGLVLDDLQGEPGASQWVHTWTPQQLDRAREHAWNRIMAALARIELVSQARGLERIALVAHQATLHFVLLRWLGLDWRSAREIDLAMDEGATSKLVVNGAGPVRVAWVNRLP